jgi:hypothetical protein
MGRRAPMDWTLCAGGMDSLPKESQLRIRHDVGAAAPLAGGFEHRPVISVPITRPKAIGINAVLVRNPCRSAPPQQGQVNPSGYK